MTLIRKFAMVGTAAIATLVILSAIASTASAQAALPFKAFGSGLKAGTVVEAFKGTTSVGKATADANGNWQIDIQPTSASNGDVISFRLNGALAVQTITFQSGQFTPPPGLALTLAAGGGTTPAPVPGKTGNAGLVGTEHSRGAEIALLLAVAVFATAGARLATRHVRR